MTVFQWSGIAATPKQRGEILYEAKAYEPLRWLRVEIDAGGGIRVRNAAQHGLYELLLFRYHAAGDVELAAAGDLQPGQQAGPLLTTHLGRDAAAELIRHSMSDGGLHAGLYADELAEFHDHYEWSERWLNEAARSRSWNALYRITTSATGALIPLKSDPVAAEAVRTLWILETDIPAGFGLDGDGGPRLAGVLARGAAASPPPSAPVGSLVLHEYGIIKQPYYADGRQQPKDASYFGWDFYDEAIILDETNNHGGPSAPIFHVWGDHPAVGQLSQNVDAVWPAGSPV